MEWIENIRKAMREAVPEITTAEFKLTGDKVEQTIRKKKNWMHLAQISLQISGGKR